MGKVYLKVNGMKVQADENENLLEFLKFLGIEIPTLCYSDGLTPQGSCRLCMVEVKKSGKSKLVTSCLYPIKEGIEVRTNTERVVKGRNMLVELMLAKCPNSKTLQDLAAKFGIQEIRFKKKHEDCILCGLCIRMCKEQMSSGAIGFIGRGVTKEVATPFKMKSELCRTCGACMYICPMVELQCRGLNEQGELCSSCLLSTPDCLEKDDQMMCYLNSCVSCVRK